MQWGYAGYLGKGTQQIRKKEKKGKGRKGNLDYSALFRINPDYLLRQRVVFASCQGEGDPCPERKNPGERQGVCAYIYTAGKGI